MPLIKTVAVQVRFGDLDPLGHVNHVQFFALMETARLEFLRAINRSLFGRMVIAHSECDHLQEIRSGTRWVDVDVSIEKVGRTSFVVLHELQVAGELVGRGRTVQVALGEDHRPRPITDDERALLTS